MEKESKASQWLVHMLDYSNDEVDNDCVRASESSRHPSTLSGANEGGSCILQGGPKASLWLILELSKMWGRFF